MRHARALELDPMVMTHGQTFERDPSYLDALMRAGLEKIAVHVDETGRDGVASNPNEQELFVVPVDGRMVSMCELNGSGMRETLNREFIALTRKAAS